MLNVRTILSILHVNRRSSSLRPTTSAQVKMRSILVTIPALALSAPGSGVLGFVSPIGGLSGRVALSSPNCARTSPLRSSKRARAREAVSMAVGAIVGAGRIGCALNDMGGGKDMLIGRSDPIPDRDGPIYVCTRNDDLEDVISRTPPARRENLVFLQNGVLGPLLDKHGLAKNTQALIYFAVAKKGEAPIDGVTDANPEGLTSACGKWAEEFQERIANGGLTCHVLPEDRYTARMYEKHIWICSFMVTGAARHCNMGEVDANYSDEVRAVIGEMQSAIEREHGVTFEDGVADRLCAYSRSVAHYPAAVKEFPWRNGFFWEISEKARKEGKEDPCPLHSKLLQQVADEQGLPL